jgi:glyoxylase-like metal-dependent hydrolase (beta-lactamase superfamily II)
MGTSETAVQHPAYGRLRGVTPQASVLLADNPGPMTLDGTNTWLLRGADTRDAAIVVDPGPADPAHLDAIVASAGTVAAIILTHHHADHSEAVAALAERTGAPVRSVRAEFRGQSPALADGEVIVAAGVRVRVWLTPGHTADSICLLVGEGPDAAVLTGDTILGRGTTVIAEPDGSLGDYLDSLRRLSGLSAVRMLPGHGPEQADAGALARDYLAHRAERLEQIRAALAELGVGADPAETDAVVDRVYADVDPSVRGAAAQSVRAQLRYLADQPATDHP